jgi:hypothetical protein
MRTVKQGNSKDSNEMLYIMLRAHNASGEMYGTLYRATMPMCRYVSRL